MKEAFKQAFEKQKIVRHQADTSSHAELARQYLEGLWLSYCQLVEAPISKLAFQAKFRAVADRASYILMEAKRVSDLAYVATASDDDVYRYLEHLGSWIAFFNTAVDDQEREAKNAELAKTG